MILLGLMEEKRYVEIYLHSNDISFSSKDIGPICLLGSEYVRIHGQWAPTKDYSKGGEG